MLTYSFTDTEGLSLYEYIYKCIKEDIITGKLTANEKLPSKRVFAKNHGISTVTVENAYGQLMAGVLLEIKSITGCWSSEL